MSKSLLSGRVAPAWPLSSVLWISALAIMASFQTWRGAFVDGALFFALVGVFITDRLTGGRIVIFRRALRAPHWLVLLATSSLAVVFIATPRRGWQGLLAIIAIGVTVFLLAWQPVRARPEPARPALLRSMTLWALLMIALLLVEATVFVLSVTTAGGSDAWPTISVLLDPVLQSVLGRAVLVTLWLAGGLVLLGVWRRS